QSRSLRVPDHKVLIGYRDRFLCLPMPEIRFTVPAALLDHGSDDDIGGEHALISRVILGYLRVLYGKIRRQTHHSAARRIEVNRLAGRICYANEVRGVFEKRHKYLTFILYSLARADVADESLPTTLGQDVCTYLDGHEGSVLPDQRPLRSFHVSRREKLGPDGLQPRHILDRNDIEDRLIK